MSIDKMTHSYRFIKYNLCSFFHNRMRRNFSSIVLNFNGRLRNLGFTFWVEAGINTNCNNLEHTRDYASLQANMAFLVLVPLNHFIKLKDQLHMQIVLSHILHNHINIGIHSNCNLHEKAIMKKICNIFNKDWNSIKDIFDFPPIHKQI